MLGDVESVPVAWMATLVFLVGLVVGSFVNVMVYRLPKKQSVVTPRSRCGGCSQTIAWYDNIPVVSYLLLRGKCRHCQARISIRYPVIELLTGLLFLAAFFKFGWDPLLLIRDFPFLTILIAVTFIDLEHRIIPDQLSLGGLIWGLLISFWVPGLGLVASVSGAALGFGVFYAFAWLYHRFTGRMGLGGGDIKLLAMLGAFLGPTGILMTILMSSLLGSVIGILYGVCTRQNQLMKVAIPYGPFLVAGALIYDLIGDPQWLQFMIPM